MKKIISVWLIIMLLMMFHSIGVENVLAEDGNGNPPDDNWWVYPDLPPGQIFAAPTFNWSKFWSVFRNHTSWSLEGWNNDTTQWEFYNDSLTVNETNISNNSRKLNLVFDAPANVTTDYRITLDINCCVNQYVYCANNCSYNLSYEVHNESFNVSYNFSDIANISGINLSHCVKGDNCFWFRAIKNNTTSGEHVELDPTYTVYAGANVNPFYPSQRKLIRQSNGTLWCTFTENVDVHVASSDDAGVTWNDREVWSAQSSIFSSLAVDSNDVVHLVFMSLKNDPDDYQLEYTNSTNWTNIVQIRDEDKEHWYPAIAVDSNDSLHIVYVKGEEGPSNSDQIAYINSTDNGGSWGTEQILTAEADPGDLMRSPSIAINNSDGIHVVFWATDHYLGKDDILHMQSSDYGGTWTDWEYDPVYQNSTYDQVYPCIAIDDNDELHVVWLNFIIPAVNEQIAYSYNNSTGWSDVEWVTWDNSLFYSQPSVSVNDNDYIHMAVGVILTSLNHSVNNTVSWTMDVPLSGYYNGPNMISAQHPTINVSKTNRPKTGYALICGFSNINITYHASSDLTWDTPIYTVYTGTNVLVSYPSQRKLVRQSNGTLWCTFVENVDVHVASSENGGVTWTDREIWGAQTCGYPSLAVDSNDVVHLVFQSLKNDADDLQLEYTNSSDWTNILQIRDEDKVHLFPSIAVDSNDNLHIVYEKGEEGPSNDEQVAYINSTDNGGSWGTEQILTAEADNFDNAWHPSIAINNSDGIHVVFSAEDHYLGKDEILHMRSSDYGDTWTNWTSDPVYQDAAHDQRFPCVAIDDNDTSHVVWVGVQQNVLDQVGYAYNNSSGWSDNEWITWEPAKAHRYPSVSVNDNDYIHAGIQVLATSLNHSVNNTISWTMDEALTGDYRHPNMISTQHPTICGVKTNRPVTGYALICAFSTTDVNYYVSDDLTWTSIDTSVDTIIPYVVISFPLDITATVTGACNVTLWYRYSTDNATWGGNASYQTDFSSPWSWSFTFSNGTGYYEFYSIGNGTAGAGGIEPNPTTFDAMCWFNWGNFLGIASMTIGSTNTGVTTAFVGFALSLCVLFYLICVRGKNNKCSLCYIVMRRKNDR